MQQATKSPPIRMEKFFSNAYQDSPAVHIGSRTLSLFAGSAYEQAYEAVHLAYAKPGDAIVVRNIDPDYITYWNKLIEDVYIYNYCDPQVTDVLGHPQFLSQVVLDSSTILSDLKRHLPAHAHLFVFFATELEQKIAQRLDIPMYGNSMISDRFGTKSGVRHLARRAEVQMPIGHICTTRSTIDAAIQELFADLECDEIIIKNNHSIGGGWSQRLKKEQLNSWNVVDQLLANVQFQEGNTTVVVEEWLAHAQASVATHIEIHPAYKTPIIRWGWEQLLESDGVSYRGAIPLRFSTKTITTIIEQTQRLADELQREGAIGSYAPNFLITERDVPILLELNARVPLSAFALSIIQKLKGEIGHGFMTQYVHVPEHTSFRKIQAALRHANVLIESSQGSATEGVVPFNVGLLPFGKCSLVAMAPTWDDACALMGRAEAALDHLRSEL